MEKVSHVLGLSPRQQVCLKLLLYNLFCSFIENTIKDVSENKDEYVATVKRQLALTAFDRYDQLCSLLANHSTISKTPSKMISCPSTTMDYIWAAVNGFDPKDSYLDDKDINYVNSEHKNLIEKVTESRKFTYTAEEIAKMKREMK